MTEMADIFYCTIGFICCLSWIALLLWIATDMLVDWYKKRNHKK